MSRPIAYNASGPLSGSIRGGSVNYTVDSGNRDYTTFASKKWVPSADGVAPIVFVTDTYTQGFELNPSLAVPLFYSCNGTGSAAIIYTANRVPGSPGNYTDANVALNDLITARGYFILESNDPYQGDYQSGNLLTLDASKMSSYPQTGTNFYDLSGNDFDFSLLNGPTFNSSGWFNMDGTDDSIGLAGNTTLKTTSTLVMWVRTTDTTGLLLTGNPPGTTGGQYVAAYNPGGDFYSGAAGSPNYFMDTLATTNPSTPINYLDGRFHMWEVRGLNFGAWTNDWYFLSYAAGYQIAGDVAKIKMFNNSLTSAQSKQLYFGAPIVTDGLVFAVDANNIVSYPKSGTSTYNLTGSGATGTLTNGTSFNISNGGSFMFDGTNDYIVFPNDTNLDSQAITMESWSNINSLFQNGFLFEKGQVNSQYSNFFNSDGTFYFRIMGLSIQDLTFYAPSYISPNTWNHIVCTYGTGTKTIYVNGIQVAQQTGITGTIPTNNTGLFLGAYGPGSSYFLNGKIANSKVYNRALTAGEVQQNYQAEQYRFETPQGIVTNGLVAYWDAGNLDSYPGTGTTWYDLSGNGYNGTLTNGTSFVSNIYGGYFNFDGVDDYVDLQYAIIGGTGDFTVNQWIQADAGEIGGTTFGNYPAGTLQIFYGTTYTGMWLNNSSTYVASPIPFSSNPVMITAIRSGTTTYFYQNDVLLKTGSSSANIGAANFRIGTNTSTSEQFTGRVFVTQTYNRALSSTEITQNYNAQKTRFGL